MAERCEESAFVGEESRFFTMMFFLDLVLPTPLHIGTILFLEASKFHKVIRGAGHHHFLFDILVGPHILFGATILTLHPRLLPIYLGTCFALTETA